MRRYELTDEQWELIRDLLPSNNGQRGRQWKDHRTILNPIFWLLRAGAPWRDLPERYGPWQTVYDRVPTLPARRPVGPSPRKAPDSPWTPRGRSTGTFGAWTARPSGPAGRRRTEG